MRVRVKQMGWYGGRRCREGEIIALKDPKDFSKFWMEEISSKVEEPEAAVKAKPGNGKSPSNKEVI